MKRQRRVRWVWELAFLACALPLGAAAHATAGDAPTLAAELGKHYRLATAQLTAEGAAAIKPGEILMVRREGIVGFAGPDQAMEEVCPSEFRSGELHTNKGALCTLTSSQNRRMFRVSDPVCITAITASASDDSVSLYLVACNGRRMLAAQTYHAMMVFHFSKGYVKTATMAHVAETIGEVLSPRSGVATTPAVDMAMLPSAISKQPQNPASAAPSAPELTVPPLDPLPSATAPEQPSQPPAASDVPTQPPASAEGVVKGQTPEQVQAILGVPSSIADLGPKVVYFYPHLKVFFSNGKVSAVQQL